MNRWGKLIARIPFNLAVTTSKKGRRAEFAEHRQNNILVDSCSKSQERKPRATPLREFELTFLARAREVVLVSRNANWTQRTERSGQARGNVRAAYKTTISWNDERERVVQSGGHGKAMKRGERVEQRVRERERGRERGGDQGENRITEHEYACFFEGDSLKAACTLGVPNYLSPFQTYLFRNPRYGRRRNLSRVFYLVLTH